MNSGGSKVFRSIQEVNSGLPIYSLFDEYIHFLSPPPARREPRAEPRRGAQRPRVEPRIGVRGAAQRGGSSARKEGGQLGDNARAERAGECADRRECRQLSGRRATYYARTQPHTALRAPPLQPDRATHLSRQFCQYLKITVTDG